MSTIVTFTGLAGDYILTRMVLDVVPRVGELVSFISKSRNVCSIPVLNVMHQIRNECSLINPEYESPVRVYVYLNIDDMELKDLGFYTKDS